MFDVPKTMRAAVYRGPNDLRIETVPVPRIGPGELLVKVAVCGVCPTDIKKIQHGTVPPPRIFGHETAGTIVRIGDGNSKMGVGSRNSKFKTQNSKFGFRVGDRVALHHHVPCLDCHACRHRAYAQCAQYKRTGVTAGFEPAGGGFAEYVRVMRFVLPGVVRIPPRNSFEEGAMLEPVNTVLKAVNRLAVLPGDKVLVAGQGPIGLMFTRLLQLRGMNVLATDLMESRLKLARKFGARWTSVPQIPIRDRQSATRNRRRPLHPPSFSLQPSLDAAVLAVPSDEALQHALHALRGGGQVLLFAHTRRGTMSGIDLASVCVDEKDLIGSYSADFGLQREVARLVFSRQLDVRNLITHRFPLFRTAAAVRLASRPTDESLKILVCPPA